MAKIYTIEGRQFKDTEEHAIREFCKDLTNKNKGLEFRIIAYATTQPVIKLIELLDSNGYNTTISEV